MKKNQFFTYSKMCVFALTGASAFFLASCAKDGFDEETFDAGVSNTQVASISADDIKIDASADGKSQTFTWPVVMGAGGYRVSLIDLSNPDEPIINDSIVDGCSMTSKREEEIIYKLTILPLGNVQKGNTDASSATSKEFSTFTPTEKTIPAGSNLNEWFTANPIPEKGLSENLNYDLEAGATYTVSGLLDFGPYKITLRSNSKTKWATINYTDVTSEISINAGFTLKYLNINCSASSQAFLSMSATPSIEPIIVTAWSADWNFYHIADPITIINCNIEGVNSYFFWDNQVQCWFPQSLLVDNCLVHLTTTADSKAKSGGYIWTNKGSGYIRNLTITNSTFYNTGEGDVKYFVQYGGFGWSQTNESLGWENNTITYENCTFYHVCSAGQWGNYNGTAGKNTSYWNMLNCIFYDCSSGNVPRRFLAGKQKQGTATFANNTYMKKDGTFEEDGNLTNYDLSGTDIKEDPMFADPENGDFHISGPTQVARKTGDPRWLP